MKLFLVMAVMLVLAVPLLIISDIGAQARTLGGQECATLRQQRQKMTKAGIGQTLEKGAQWAAQNLDDRQLGEVGEFLQLMEKIRFRCKGSKVDSKNKFGLHANVPLPVRNSRRLKKVKLTEKPVVVAPNDTANAEIKASNGQGNTPGGMTSETKAVLSAITKKPVGAASAMRKSIEN